MIMTIRPINWTIRSGDFLILNITTMIKGSKNKIDSSILN